MRRREFITALGGLALCWPIGARAQKPKIPRVGYLFSFTEREGRHLWDACRQGLHDLGYVEGRNIVLEPRAANEHAEALVVFDDPVLWSFRAQIVAQAAMHKMPAIYGFKEFVDSGGLMSYGPDRPEQYRRTAVFVDKLLKGAKPADLPVEQPTKFALFINSKTAKTLGVELPQALLLRADEVIE